jgi:hypothetical protein
MVVCPVPAAGSHASNRIDETLMLIQPHRCSIDAVARLAIGRANPAKRASPKVRRAVNHIGRRDTPRTHPADRARFARSAGAHHQHIFISIPCSSFID